MENKFEINAMSEKTELIIREGVAAPTREKRPLKICGTIDLPLRYLKNRYEDQLHDIAKTCHILVNQDRGSITLTIGEHEQLHDSLEGKLVISSEIENFGINNGEYIDPDELAEFLRMRKHYFETQAEYTNTFTALRSFTAKVNQEIASIKDDSGNYDVKRKQAVEHNVPKSFGIKVPLFRETEIRYISVDILVNNALKVTMYSAELIQLTDELRKDIMVKTIEDIQKVAPDIGLCMASSRD